MQQQMATSKRPRGGLPVFPIDVTAVTEFQGDPVNVCIGSVSYEPNKGFTLSRNGDLGFEPTTDGIVLDTASGHSLRLWSNRPTYRYVIPQMAKLMFDVALLGQKDLSRSVAVTKWKMPCNAILEHVESPITPAFKHRTITELRARNKVHFRGKLRRFRADVHLELAYEVTGQATGEHNIEPLASFQIDYRKPRSVSDILEQEKEVRGFLDFIWMRPHASEYLLLWEKEELMRLNRTVIPPREQTLLEKTLLFDGVLVYRSFNSWLNKWLELDPAYHRAINNVLRVIRYPQVITDLRFVMAVHAFEAFHEVDHKAAGLKERLVATAGPMYDYSGLTRSEPLVDYFGRMVNARNEIIHLRYKAGPILKEEERTKALYEMLTVIRAMVMEKFGASQIEIQNYCIRSFRSLHRHSYKYTDG